MPHMLTRSLWKFQLLLFSESSSVGLRENDFNAIVLQCDQLEIQNVEWSTYAIRSLWLRSAQRGAPICPAARDEVAAVGAGGVFQAVCADVVPGALDQQRVAFGAASIATIADNISFVDVMQSNFAGDRARAMQSFRRRARLVLQFEIRMKRGEVQRNVGAEIFENPFGERARFVFVVVQCGNH